MRADRGEAVFVTSGPSAAGKSTVARQLASRFARGVHLEGDTPRLGLWIDSTDQTPDATVEEILRRTASDT